MAETEAVDIQALMMERQLFDDRHVVNEFSLDVIAGNVAKNLAKDSTTVS